MFKLPTRQVHLDFHTSEQIPGVGAGFRKENFQEALKQGHLNSITIFAKCHHSMCYYPTKVGTMHPNLEFDLMGAMMEASHEIGVRTPVYITVGWSAMDAENHPEWVVRNKDGSMAACNYDLNAGCEDKKPIVSWKFLCPNGDYEDHLIELTKEICNRYKNIDGLFYDICFGPLCWCDRCLKGMYDAGLNPEIEEDVMLYHKILWQKFMRECTGVLNESHKEATIFFNGGANPNRPEWHRNQTHFEMEDLPTTWGGYDKMPLRAKYFAHSGKDYLGMTGKFHTMWGEFGGFKNPEALKYECASMLAFGAHCSIGDQMHPSGEMDLETYRLIGNAYEYVEKIEEWCYGVKETTTLGIFRSENEKSDEGMVKMLMEAHLDFDVVSNGCDLSDFNTVILPDIIVLDDSTAGRLNKFIEKGGNVLLTGKSGLDKDGKKFMIDCGADYLGPANYENDYLILDSKLNEGMIKSPFLFYEGAERISLTDGEVLSTIKEPYFNRTYGQYCSHQNSPYKLEITENPGAVIKGNVVYIAHPICKLYYEHGAQIHRDYFIKALSLIYKYPVLKVEGLPSAGRVRFVKQPHKGRYILHLLYASPIQRGRALVIEDLPPIYNIKVNVTIKDKIKRVYLAPERREISFSQEDENVKIIVPELKCHQIVVFDTYFA